MPTILIVILTLVVLALGLRLVVKRRRKLQHEQALLHHQMQVKQLDEQERLQDELHRARGIEAELNASWQPCSINRWDLEGTDSSGSVHRFAQLAIHKVGLGMCMVHYCGQQDHDNFGVPTLNTRIILDGDQFIGDENWALSVVLKVTEEGWIPRVLQFSKDVSHHYYDVMGVRKDSRDVTTVGFVGFVWKNGISVGYKTEAYPDDPQRWLLTWFGGYGGYHRLLRTSTNEVAEAAGAATEAFTNGMPPRHGLWATANQSA